MRIKGSDEYEALITEENADGSNEYINKHDFYK